ncbi:MAG TPA: hypothetical protein VGN86_13745 [Pyrinomonadaceae bacterium]|jgi:hypothetical protein|nr:hypothetical protein [Pyrinomonadaceae bacterium]
MVTLLFTSIVVLIVLILAVYLWQKPAVQSQLTGMDESGAFLPRERIGLFPDNNDNQLPSLNGVESAIPQLLERAAAGDNTTADEAYKSFDRRVYDEILAALVKQADSEARLLSVLSHVTRNELPVTNELAQAAIQSWKNSPDRSSTARTLHITALADDARLYQNTVEFVLNLWRLGSLNEVSAAELRSLIDGEFWVLSNQTRSSGAGFILKRSLAKARRELEAAIGNQ